MKSLVASLVVTASLSASLGQAEVIFVKDGTAKTTKAANGLNLTGEEAQALYAALTGPNVSERKNSPVKETTERSVTLDSATPHQNILVCSETSAGVECYIGTSGSH